MNIEIPFIEDKELQKRMVDGLMQRGFEVAIPKSVHAQFYIVKINTPQDAFWIGCNYVSLVNKLFDGPLTKTFA